MLLFVVFVVTNAPLLLPLLLALARLVPAPPRGATNQAEKIPERPNAVFLWQAFAVVAGVFALNIAVLWLLRKIGGPLQADVKATIRKFGGSLAVTSAGLIGAFLALSVFAFGGMYVVAMIFGEK